MGHATVRPNNGRWRVGSDEEKIERSLKDRGLLFPIASDETACDEDQRSSKNSVLNRDPRKGQGQTTAGPVHGDP